VKWREMALSANLVHIAIITEKHRFLRLFQTVFWAVLSSENDLKNRLYFVVFLIGFLDRFYCYIMRL
jgi:hypothetical protein